jgi:hypothetical protein
MHCRRSWSSGNFVLYTLDLMTPQRSLMVSSRGNVAPNISLQFCYPCVPKSAIEVVTHMKMMRPFLSLKCKNLRTVFLGMSSWLLKRRIDAHEFCSFACWIHPASSSEVCGLPERFSSSTIPVLLNLLTGSRILALVGAGFRIFIQNFVAPVDSLIRAIARKSSALSIFLD